jgi:hypothetical protein
MGVSVPEDKNNPKTIQSVLGNMIKKIIRIFDWIAEGQTAGALCKG